MKTLLTYYGGKQHLAEKIVELIPPHILYGEPFAGGAAVFWAKRPSEAEVLNDMNGELMNFYKVMQCEFDALFELVSATLLSRQQHAHARVINTYPELFTTVQRAWATWVLCMQSFSSKMDGAWGFDLMSDTTSMKVLHNKQQFSHFYSSRLEHVQLECRDALYVIKSRDHENAFFYCDPPYYNSHLGHYKGYTLGDFQQLLDTLAAIKGKFLLSSYPSDILNRYTNSHHWNRLSFDMTVSVNMKSGKKKPKTEVLTANYPLVPYIHQLSLFHG